VDEYLSEKEQIEAIRTWWRENGWYLVGGAAVAAIAYFGYNQYQAYRNGQAEQAAALYLRMQETFEDDRPGADDLLAQLASEFPDSPYTDHARLLIASESLISDPARAVEELRTVMTTSGDPGLAMVARLRLARVLAYQERYPEALELLTVAEAGNFSARLNELLGDIHVALGDAAAARRAYTVALTEQGAETLDQNLLQMKLGDLLVPLPTEDAAASEDPGSGTESSGDPPAEAQAESAEATGNGDPAEAAPPVGEASP
jgi:predicted negative regulator of RcsB-dependent stress response